MGESAKETFCHVFCLCPSAPDLLTNSGVWPGASGFYTGSRANGRVQTSKLQIRVFFATLCSARHHNGSASVEEQILVLRVAESSKSHNSKADEEDFEEEEDYEEEGLEAEEE